LLPAPAQRQRSRRDADAGAAQLPLVEHQRDGGLRQCSSREGSPPQRTAARRRRDIVRAATLAAFVALAAACGRAPSQDAAAADEATVTVHAVPVKVARVEQGIVDRVIATSGLVTPGPGADMVVVAPQPARIARLAVAVGDVVAKGQVLVEFDIPSLEADRAQRESEVAQAQARLRNAESNGTRLAHLFERGIAAQKEAEDAQKELSDARAAMAQTTRARAVSDTLATRQVVRMPFNGIVAQRWRSAGEIVDGTSAMPVLRVIDPDRLQVEAAVPPEEAALVRPGQPARIRGARTAADARPWDGKVLTAPRVVDALSGAAIARVTLPHNAAPSGLPVQVEIIVERVSGLVVPASALVRDGDKTWCYVVTADVEKSESAKADDAAARGTVSAKANDKAAAEASVAKTDSTSPGKPEKEEAPALHAERREVSVGLVTTSQAQIIRGLAAGERVITQGNQSLPDAAAVRVEP
jgi:cobalt-zinc-cadmium efflux system membrane fusion protein